MSSPLSFPHPERERVGSSCDLGRENSREGSHSIFPFAQWQSVLFLPNGPLEGGCPGEALGQQLAESLPGAPPRRWEISFPCQTTWLLGSERASHTAPRLQTFIRTAFSTFRAFMGCFFFIPSSTYELTNISRMESCCKLRAPKIYHHVFDNLGTFLSLQMYAFVHIFFSYSLKSALIVTRSRFQ